MDDVLTEQFVRNAWSVAAWDFEVEPGKVHARRILGEDVALYRDAQGKVVAMVDRCCHRLAPLSRGQVEAGNLRCMYHGLLFDPSGRCIEVPQMAKPPRALTVRTFPVVERDRYIWIWMGDAERADTALVPDAHWQVDPAWRSIPGYVHYEAANYLLIMDNLLDFSHLGFVHATTLGGGRSADIKPKIERFDWGVRVTRWYLNDDLPPFLAKVARFRGPVDRWQVYEWHAANNLLSMDSGSAPARTGAPEGHIVPEACVFHSVQSLTPESATSTHYFWTFAHNFELDNAAITRELADQIEIGFGEDKAMIQAQQQVILDHPHAKMTGIPADAALHHVRQLIGKLLV
ncbi:MAG TPA: aromatic ring-hydroxylating dioxygenase subunit alpha [Sphingobium sp.]